MADEVNITAFNTGHDDELTNYDDLLDINSAIVETVVSCLISVIDLAVNVINSCVFISQGLKNSVDVSFLTIAVMELVRIVFLQVSTFSLGPLAAIQRVPQVLLEVFFVTVGCPMGAAIRVTLHVTVYVTAERCLCLMFPLQVKMMITKRVTVCVVMTIIAFNSVILYPIYHYSVVLWDSYDSENTTLPGGISLKAWSETLETVYFFHTLLIVVGLGLLIIFTSLLVLQLLEKSSWRAENRRSAANSADFLAITRDRKSIRLVMAISVFLVVSFLPMVIDSLFVIFMPEFYFWEMSDSLFHHLFHFSLLSVAMNSCLSIVIYYKMSTGYRKTLKGLFILKFRNKIRSFYNLHNVD